MLVGRFTVFCHLWAIAGFCEWHRWTWTESSGSWALLASSVLLFAFPSSVPLLALYAGTQMTFAALAMNSPWNHGLFMALLNLGLLLAIGRSALARLRAGGTEWDREALIDAVAPMLRVSLIVLYLWTWFHKLNADFLNPEVSCAGVLMTWMDPVYGFLPLERWAFHAAIAGTLFVELAVPLLLCFRRTVYVGLAIGAGFHLFLSQFGGLHGFAAMLFALYYLFLPRTFTEAIDARVRSWLAALEPLPLRRFALPALALAGGVVGAALGYLFGLDYTTRGMLFWDLWLVGVLAGFRRELFGLWRMPADFTLRQQWAPLAVVPLLVLVNGAMPYLGLKTETSWAMYSNLRTEAAPNHLLVSGAARPFAFQDDLFTIEASSLPALAEYAGEPVALTAHSFRRITGAASGDFSVTYRRNGEPGTLFVVGGVSSDPELTTPPPWWVQRLLPFRPVDTGPHATCRH